MHKAYGPDGKYCGREISWKYSIEYRAHSSWPKYALYKEDMLLRDSEKWDAKYGELRPVMWDMTNVPVYEFTDADFI